IEPSPIVAALGTFEDYSAAVGTGLRRHPGVLVLSGPRGEKTGASQLRHLLTGETGGSLPDLDFDLERRRLNAVREAVRSGVVRSCHDISEGGLAVAALEMALGGFAGGGFGLQIPISGLGDTAPEIRLYSEAPGFLMETSSEKLGELLHLFARHGVDATMIGRTIPEPKLRFLDAGTTLIEADLADLRKAYGGALRPYVE
ncbi:MAG TPA: AIR synthase-related protein, partial [Candidatus Limnocylindrales bacterium]|nr:AIR synthase-related protein [Candidatus Limnocylindrales bacterium]